MMTTADDVRRLALSLEGTTEAPHFNRVAYRVRRIYVTVSPDRRTINLMLTVDEQAFKVMMATDIYSAVPNAWGRKGATTAVLARMSKSELKKILHMAWEHAAAAKAER